MYMYLFHTQVGLILAVEAGIFPLMCGWWIDICSFVSVNVTVALKYTLSRFEVMGDSTELSSIQLSSAQFNYANSVHRAQLSSTALSSIQLSSARFN